MRTFGRVGTTDRSSLIAAVLISALAIGSACAEEGSSGSHGDGKGSATPSASGDNASAKGSGGDGARESTKESTRESGKGDARSSPAGDGKGRPSGSNEPSGHARDTSPSAQTGKDNATVEPRVEPSRRLDRNNRPGENPLPRVPGTQGLTRRLAPVPHAPNPVRNSIGVVVPAPARIEPHEAPHSPTVVSHPPTVALPGPGNTGVGIPKPGLTNRPAVSPTVTPSLPNRGAITGTGLTRRNVAPPRIGGPVNSVAGINGTAIRSKH